MTMLLGRPPTTTLLIATVWAAVVVPVARRLRRGRAIATATAVSTAAEGQGRDERQPRDRHRGERPRPQPARARLARGQHRGRLVGGDDGLLAVAGGGLADGHDALGPRCHGLARGGERSAAEVTGRGKAVVGVLRHGPREDGVEARRHVRRAVVQRRRIVVEVRPQRRLVALALVGRNARERVVEHAAQGVDIGAGVEALAADLLGRDVAQRPDPTAVARRAGVRGHAFGQPEVGEVRVVVGAQQHVGGLDVAVHDAARVRRVEGARDLGDDVRGACRVQALLGAHERAQVRALDVAHRDVQGPRRRSRPCSRWG